MFPDYRPPDNLLQIRTGVLSDCRRAKERGKTLTILSFAPLLGPAVVPITGGFIPQHTTLQWILWAGTIFDAVVQIVAFFFLWETFEPLLARKALTLRKSTSDPRLRTVYWAMIRTPGQLLRINKMRPPTTMAKHVVAQVVTFYGRTGFGVLYMMLADCATL